MQFLFKAILAGTNFQIVILPGQESALGVTDYAELGTLSAPYEKITVPPIETVFIADGITRKPDGTTAINDTFKPMFFRNTLFVSGTAKPTEEEVQYLIDYMTTSKDFGLETARTYCNQFQAYSYTAKVTEPASMVEAIVDLITEAPATVAPVSAPMVATPKYANLKERIVAEYPCPTEKSIGFYIDRDNWHLLVRNILKGQNTILCGPTGTGKTELVQHVCKAVKRELFIQDMGTIQDAQSALLGVHRLDKDGHSEFDYAPFANNVQKEGIMLLDEMNRSPLSANNILFPCLDSRRYLPIDIAGGSDARNIAVHEGLTFFATANLGSEYSGTQQIDRALFDRFFKLELEYPKESVEVKILMSRTGVEKKIAEAIVKVAGNIRKQHDIQELSNSISVRHTLLTAELVYDGFDLNTGLSRVIMPMFDDEQGASERAKVKTIIAAL